MKKILVLYGDIWHPVEVVHKGLSYLTEFYDDMEFMEDAKDMLTAADLKQYDLIINCKGNNLTSGNKCSWFDAGVNEATPADFREYVENGGGFLSVHAGNSFFETGEGEQVDAPAREYIDFVGCRFVTHPARCPVNYQVLSVSHPVTEGVSDFIVRDEHYQIEMTTEDALILMTSSSADGADMPAAYVREIGQGRLCSLMPGHILEVWKNPQFQKLLSNAIKWCIKK